MASTLLEARRAERHARDAVAAPTSSAATAPPTTIRSP